MKRILIALSIYVTAGLTVCGDTFENRPVQLALPDIPASITVPKERAAYLLCHFWDAMDWNDSVMSSDIRFLEQSWADFSSLFPHADSSAVRKGAEILFRASAANPGAQSELLDIANTYMHSSDSPFQDELSYIQVLRGASASGSLGDYTALLDYRLNEALLNAPGSPASDFSFIDSYGKSGSLYQQNPKAMKLLIFYDPDCDHCHHAMAALRGSNEVRRLIAHSTLQIICIYYEGDPSVWSLNNSGLDKEWIWGYTPDNAVEESGAYIFPQSPTLYLLSPDNKVILKDTTIEKIFTYLENRH